MSLEPIRHELVVRCTPERGFEKYATRMGEWWHPLYTADAVSFSGVTVETRVGGRVVETHAGGAEYEWGRVTAWEPGRRFGYTSTLAQAQDVPSEIVVRFAPHPDGCAVRFEHGGWTDGNASDRRKFGDWPVILARFAALAETEDV